MAIALYPVHDATVRFLGTGTNSTNFTFSSALTAGRGLVLLVTAHYNAGTYDCTGVTLSNSQTMTKVSGQVASDQQWWNWWYLPEITAGTLTGCTVSYTGGVNGLDAGVAGLEVTGHDTTTMVPTQNYDAQNPAHIVITTQYANSAVVALIPEGVSDGGSASGYTLFDCVNPVSYQRIFYDEDAGAAGSKDTAATYGTKSFNIEIKAAAGSTVKPHYYYAQL